MDNYLNWIFTRQNSFYAVICVPVIGIGVLQYIEGSYILAIFQGVCLGSIITSWLFSIFKLRLNKANEVFNREGK